MRPHPPSGREHHTGCRSLLTSFLRSAGRSRTPAVSRRATQDSRMRKSYHWRGRLQCVVRPSRRRRAPCPPPPVRFAAGPVDGEWCRGRAVLACMSWPVCLGLYALACMSWPVCLGLCVLACMSWPVCLGLCVLGLLPWLCCLGIPVRVRDLRGPNACGEPPRHT